ncbi:MAG: hypothetical protein B7Y00_02500 [Sphingomonadales bacterium 17-56-6]|nr:MAG: hypothetical protein B7Y44_03300 [Sphingomonadales bacterium 28-55-16]OYZ89008.1 MAG: hypothetical protein B7Y00_02500 [Sphingomonadales bacterium 17-56-6]
MIELPKIEKNAVFGGYASTTDDIGGVMSSLASQWRPRDLGKDYITAYKLNQYREANPNSPTWYADFFGL